MSRPETEIESIPRDGKKITNYGWQYQEVSEIEEENSSELFEINHHRVRLPSIKEDYSEGSLFSFDINKSEEDVVYVPVGKSDSSMDALKWTLKNLVNQATTTVYLIHIFPEIHMIPTPLGYIPVTAASQKQVENYKVQERGKSRELLKKYLNICLASKVKVDNILIECNNVANAIVDLIPILNIRKMVIGTNKSNLRKLKSKKGSGIADKVRLKAPDFCEVKIICEGKEVLLDQTTDSPLSLQDNYGRSKPNQEQDQRKDHLFCMCFNL